MKFKLLPHNLGTAGGRELIRSLGGLMIHPTRGTYRKRNAHRIINWGNSGRVFDSIFGAGDFNHPAAVAGAVDKLASFSIWSLTGVNHPEWTRDIDTARRWLSLDGYVLGRDTSTGSGGSGIHIYKRGENETLATHLFYTRYCNSRREYRIHVGRVGLIDVVQKRKRSGSNADTIVRSHNNGWVFCRNDIVPPSAQAVEMAVAAITALDLDFGAVDVGVAKDGTATVFEVNTAPGIEGTTLAKYRDYFLNA